MSQSLLLEKTKKVDFVNDMFKEGEMDPANLPTHPCPPGKKDGSMRTDLLEFQVRSPATLSFFLPKLTTLLQSQKQGLAWMIKMEHPELPKSVDDKPVQLWAKKKDVEVRRCLFFSPGCLPRSSTNSVRLRLRICTGQDLLAQRRDWLNTA
jgi:SWI/SNF-related matrix-associated actin-dependent regulator of chromatin subfamily A3